MDRCWVVGLLFLVVLWVFDSRISLSDAGDLEEVVCCRQLQIVPRHKYGYLAFFP